MFEGPVLMQRMMFLVPVLLSLTVHEWAHARSAYALGDDTASLMGRMTLNPLSHIDILGTIILPLMGVPFGWAKPVPINPVRFNRKYSMRWSMLLTAAAGPLSNVVLAFASAGMLVITTRVFPTVFSSMRELNMLLTMMVRINVALAIFNMIPVPPLDGSRVADYFMPERLRPWWDSIYRSGPIALVLLLIGLQFAGGFLMTVIGGAVSFIYWIFGF